MNGAPLFWRLLAAGAAVAAVTAVVALAAPPSGLFGEAGGRIPAAAGLVLVAAVVAGLAGLLSRWITRPLREIASRVGAASPGEAVEAGGAGFRESQMVADAVNSLASQLAQAAVSTKRETALRDEILSAMEEGVILWGPDGRVLYANRAAGDIFGPRISGEVPAELASPGVTEMRVHHPQPRELRITRVRAGEGNSVAIVQDVTATKRLEAVRRDFVANASHELKTPVSGMLAAAETMAAASDDPEALTRFAPRVLEEARRMSALVGDLLDLERLEQESPAPVVFDPAAVVEAEASAARARAEAKGLAFSLQVPRESFAMKGSPGDLALLVRNLLDNAVNYTSSGRISVGLRREVAGIVLEVEDTGPGIPSRDAERVFERFYRVDKARSRATGGTGLGLSIVRHVAEQHGGRVAVRSQMGRGSTFIVTLPVE